MNIHNTPLCTLQKMIIFYLLCGGLEHGVLARDMIGSNGQDAASPQAVDHVQVRQTWEDEKENK